MASLFKNPVHNTQQGYNGFDMSHKVKFSSTVGELLPIYYDILQPSDKVSINTELRTRTQPLRTAAMVDIKEHIDWFFVPLSQIYSIFGDWFYGIQDFKSSLFNPDSILESDLPPHLPFITAPAMKSFIQFIQTQRDPVFNMADLMGTQFRLMEMLGYPGLRFANALSTEGSVVAPCCPILFCAYQKIYSDYYRLTDREANNAFSYNLDHCYTDTEIDAVTDKFRDIFTLRYRPMKKDFFTNIFTSPLFDSHNNLEAYPSNSYYVDIANNWLGNSYSGNTQLMTPAGNNTEPNGSNATQIGNSNTSTIRNTNQTSLIRTNFAIEKMLEITRRAGKHVDDQTLAHFGIKPHMGISGECVYLGSSTSDIKIGDVIATSSGDDVSLGEIAGKGYGYGKGKNIRFTAPFQGIIMGIYSAVPEIDYYSLGVDKLNLLMSRQDWYMQEFDNLGMQPLFGYQAFVSDTSGYDASTRLGWQYRYSELKTKYNRVLGSLGSGRSLNDWVVGTYMRGNQLPHFLTNPTLLNTIMLGNYSFTVPTAFEDDPLIHELYLDVKKSSKMSVYSLPSL